ITALAGDTFRDLQGLERLLLHRNLLSEVQPTAFQGLGLLDTLFLFENRLQELPGPALQPLASLRFLRLSGNPWACDCRALALRHWFRRFTGASSALECAGPPGLRGRDLRLLTPADFQGCPGLGPRLRPGKVEPPANQSQGGTGVRIPPPKGQAGEDWPGEYDYPEALPSPGLGHCEGGGCRRNSANQAPGIFLYPVWGLALMWAW
ncbi:hypothetical protein chiPu_0029981, partial [Chiloscyllium punctatum]|nr:hypothetical protein [Chiloscyllium punctatum]